MDSVTFVMKYYLTTVWLIMPEKVGKNDFHTHSYWFH